MVGFVAATATVRASSGGGSNIMVSTICAAVLLCVLHLCRASFAQRCTCASVRTYHILADKNLTYPSFILSSTKSTKLPIHGCLRNAEKQTLPRPTTAAEQQCLYHEHAIALLLARPNDTYTTCTSLITYSATRSTSQY